MVYQPARTHPELVLLQDIVKRDLIGLGRIGWGYHLAEIVRHPGFNLVAATDASEERVNEIKEKHSVAGYTNYLEMYEKENPDLVVIASPTNFHCEQALQAMERGIDVFVDKPIAVDLHETDKMIETMKKQAES